MRTAAETGVLLAGRLRGTIDDVESCLCEDNRTVMIYVRTGGEWLALYVDVYERAEKVLHDVLTECERVVMLARRQHLTLIDGGRAILS
jgi:hypothetical protein